MPIDPRIAMGYQAPQIESPMNAMAKMIQLRQAEQQNQLGTMKMREYERGVEEQNRLRSVLSGLSGDTDEQVRTLTREGFLDPARKLAESHAKANADRRAGEKSEADVAAAKTKQLRDLLPSVQDQTSYDVWRALVAKELPQAVAMVPPQFSPQTVQRLMLTADQALKKHFVNQDAGGSMRTIEMPEYGPGGATVVPGSVVVKTMTPGEAERIPLERQRVALEGQRVGLEGRRVGLEERRVRVAEKEAAREATMGNVELAPKDKQAREAKYPAATVAVKTFETKSEELAKDIEKLAKHPGLSGITGLIWGRTPALTDASRQAKVLYDSIIARGGFKELSDMRAASPTGGALGNVSNQEGQYLRDAFAPLGREQDTRSMSQALVDAAKRVRESKDRVREAYDMTYEYKKDAAPTAVPTPLSSEDKQALDWATANPSDPRASEIKKRLGR